MNPIRAYRVREVLSLRAAGHVKRWHTVRTLQQQTVAEHCHHCLSLLLLLHPKPSIDLIMAMQWHDSAELRLGDIPAMAKRNQDVFAEACADIEDLFTRETHETVWNAQNALTAEDWSWIKAIDTLELILWARDEVALGNESARLIMARGRAYIRDDAPSEVKTLLAQVGNGPAPVMI